MRSNQAAPNRHVIRAAMMSAWMLLYMPLSAVRVVAARLTVKSASQSTASPQSEQDKALAAKKAEELANEGMALFREGSAESLRAAIKKWEEAATWFRAAGNRGWEATMFLGIGRVYDDLSEKQKALEYYNQALPLYRTVGDRRGEATTLNNIGGVYDALGEKQKALGYYNQALPLRRAVGDRGGEAATLTNIGLVYSALGEKQKALEYYNQALPLYRTVRDRGGEATTLNNIGRVYDDLGEEQKALEYYNQALPLYRTVGDRAGEAATLNNIGGVYDDLGEKQKALGYYNQALPLLRAVGDRSGEATTLNNIGRVYDDLGEEQKALDYYNQALPLLRAVGDRRVEATTLHNLMFLWNALKKPRLAVFYGKQAVNTYQSLRADIQGLDKELQKSFLKSNEDTYQKLAELLIAEARLSEAQQVLDLLKEEEYFDFVRRDSRLSPTTAKAEYRPDEAKAKEKEDSVTAIGTKLAELEAKALRTNLTPEEEQRRVSYTKQLESAEQQFQSALGVLAKEINKADLSGHAIAGTIEEERGLMDDLRELGAGTVALYTLVGEEKYYVILMTSQTRIAREYPIKAADLSKKIFAFREAVQNPKADPLPLAQELYKILVAPVARDLEGARSKPDETLTLMWQLYGVLRYVPIAALHDGRNYMVERYRNVVYTPASKARLKDAVSAHWKALGLGVSKPHSVDKDRFPALPAVPAELRGIIRDDATANQSSQTTASGVLPGKAMLDEAFTIDALKSARLRYQLVHIASHFQFRPGDETKSYLLLGDGSAFTLAQLRLSGMLFSGVDLLTLSACNTAIGDKDANGKEIEGFGVMAQQQGAKAVVASLWPVADASTKELMSEFYRRRETTAGIAKAEALRQAQLALLYGSNGSAPTSAEMRGPQASNKPSEFKANPHARYSHPYFWAPFILIGNWK